MNLLTRVTAIAVAVCFLAANCSANFVIDDFTTAGVAAEGTVVTPSSNFVFTTGVGYQIVPANPLASGESASIEYDFTANTDLAGTAAASFASSGNPSIPFPSLTGLEFLFNTNPGSSPVGFELLVDGISSVAGTLGTSPQSISVGPSLATAGTIEFVFTNNDPTQPITFTFGNNLTAVPEPTALLMFGSVVGLGLIRRRAAK